MDPPANTFVCFKQFPFFWFSPFIIFNYEFLPAISFNSSRYAFQYEMQLHLFSPFFLIFAINTWLISEPKTEEPAELIQTWENWCICCFVSDRSLSVLVCAESTCEVFLTLTWPMELVAVGAICTSTRHKLVGTTILIPIPSSVSFYCHYHATRTIIHLHTAHH